MYGTLKNERLKSLRAVQSFVIKSADKSAKLTPNQNIPLSIHKAIYYFLY